MGAMEDRAALLARIDALREQAFSGEIEAFVGVVFTDRAMRFVFGGAAQTVRALLGATLVFSAYIHERIYEALNEKRSATDLPPVGRTQGRTN